MALSALACGGTAPDGNSAEGAGPPIASRQLPVVGDPATPTHYDSADSGALAILWNEKLGGSVKKATDSLTADIVNHTPDPQKVRVLLEGAGLDGRIASRALGEYLVPGGGSITVAVPVSTLPVQSHVAPSLAVLRTELERPQGGIERRQTALLHHVFDASYGQVELYSGQERARLPKGGLRTTDAMDVQGRVWDTRTGTMQTVGPTAASMELATTAGPSERREAAQSPRQGLTLVGGPKPGEPDPRKAARTAAAAGSQATAAAAAVTMVPRKFCAYWMVWYSDSGFGEDVYTVPGYAFVPASYIWVGVQDSTTNYYYGNTDKNGCTPSLQVPANSTLSVYQYTDWQIDSVHGIQFDNWFRGVNQYDMIATSVQVGSATTLQTIKSQPAYNSNPIQSSAVVSYLMWKNNSNLSQGLDQLISPDRRCIIADEDGTNIPRQFSMWGGVLEVEPGVYIHCAFLGDQSGGDDYPGAWFKFLTAHELGHALGLQFHGSDASPPPMDEDPVKVCNCSHTLHYPILPEHCLQGKMSRYGASAEGFAQFYAARLWNSDTQPNATFVYYKRWRTADTEPPPVIYPPFAVDAYNPLRWMEQSCSGGPSFNDMGVEGDWMTFYYNVTSRDRINRTSLADLDAIQARACGSHNPCDAPWSGPAGGPSYAYDLSYLDAAAAVFGGTTTRKYLRFSQAAVAHGVAHN